MISRLGRLPHIFVNCRYPCSFMLSNHRNCRIRVRDTMCSESQRLKDTVRSESQRLRATMTFRVTATQRRCILNCVPSYSDSERRCEPSYSDSERRCDLSHSDSGRLCDPSHSNSERRRDLVCPPSPPLSTSQRLRVAARGRRRAPPPAGPGARLLLGPS